MKRVVVFSGAGVSADSGLATFRSADGLWASHRIEDVCTAEALERNRVQVIDFYNARRRELLDAKPNAGHRAIVELEQRFEVEVITQNIDDLHERAGSRSVIHLHGELLKLCSSRDTSATVPIDGWQQQINSRHADGTLLRPFVVFFGESVPRFDDAARVVQGADILIVVGTSLAVYPAASLVGYAKESVPIYLVDPGEPKIYGVGNRVVHIRENSATGLPQLVQTLLVMP